MKKQKLKLEDLKVQSFVTSMEKQQKQTIDGGLTPTFALASITASIISNITRHMIDDTATDCISPNPTTIPHTDLACPPAPDSAGGCSNNGHLCCI